ncbi:magnesium transporter MRS2 homolog, mitochondrial [Lampetra fluviatilis]
MWPCHQLPSRRVVVTLVWGAVVTRAGPSTTPLRTACSVCPPCVWARGGLRPAPPPPPPPRPGSRWRPRLLLTSPPLWGDSAVGMGRHFSSDPSQAALASVIPVFSVMKFDKTGLVCCFERRKTELYTELGLQARDLRFQPPVGIFTRNNRIILHMEQLKAVVSTDSLLVLDYRHPSLESWLQAELGPQLAGEGQLASYSLPFEFWALEAILQHQLSELQSRLGDLESAIMAILDALVDPKLLSIDRGKLHLLLQSSKSLSELETDVRVLKDVLLKILDDEELMEELCLSKWSNPRAYEASSVGMDHADEMELLLEVFLHEADALFNAVRELKGLIDDSESVIFLNLDSHRNVMMRLNLQLTMGTFSLSLFGLIGVAFGMNLNSSLEEDPRVFWLVTGLMLLGSGLMWRRLLSFLGRHLDPSSPPAVPSFVRRTQSKSAAAASSPSQAPSKATLPLLPSLAGQKNPLLQR